MGRTRADNGIRKERIRYSPPPEPIKSRKKASEKVSTKPNSKASKSSHQEVKTPFTGSTTDKGEGPADSSLQNPDQGGNSDVTPATQNDEQARANPNNSKSSQKPAAAPAPMQGRDGDLPKGSGRPTSSTTEDKQNGSAAAQTATSGPSKIASNSHGKEPEDENASDDIAQAGQPSKPLEDPPREPDDGDLHSAWPDPLGSLSERGDVSDDDNKQEVESGLRTGPFEYLGFGFAFEQMLKPTIKNKQRWKSIFTRENMDRYVSTSNFDEMPFEEAPEGVSPRENEVKRLHGLSAERLAACKNLVRSASLARRMPNNRLLASNQTVNLDDRYQNHLWERKLLLGKIKCNPYRRLHRWEHRMQIRQWRRERRHEENATREQDRKTTEENRDKGQQNNEMVQLVYSSSEEDMSPSDSDDCAEYQNSRYDLVYNLHQIPKVYSSPGIERAINQPSLHGLKYRKRRADSMLPDGDSPTPAAKRSRSNSDPYGRNIDGPLSRWIGVQRSWDDARLDKRRRQIQDLVESTDTDSQPSDAHTKRPQKPTLRRRLQWAKEHAFHRYHRYDEKGRDGEKPGRSLPYEYYDEDVESPGNRLYNLEQFNARNEKLYLNSIANRMYALGTHARHKKAKENEGSNAPPSDRPPKPGDDPAHSNGNVDESAGGSTRDHKGKGADPQGGKQPPPPPKRRVQEPSTAPVPSSNASKGNKQTGQRDGRSQRDDRRGETRTANPKRSAGPKGPARKTSTSKKRPPPPRPAGTRSSSRLKKQHEESDADTVLGAPATADQANVNTGAAPPEYKEDNDHNVDTEGPGSTNATTEITISV